MALSLAAGLTGPKALGRQHVGAELIGRAGAATTVTLEPNEGAFSPACGCADPTGAASDWHGFVVPSEGFNLHTEMDSTTWMLTSVAPMVDGGVDWFGQPPARTSSFTVQVGSHVLFNGRGTYVTALGQADITVDHGHRFPVLAVIPGAHDKITMSSAPGPRPGSGGTGTMTIDNPARDFFNWDSEEEGVEEMFRGPAIDIIGPAITFAFKSGPGTKVWIAKRALPDIPEGRRVTITQRVAWSTRVMVQPVKEGHVHALEEIGTRGPTVKEMTDDGMIRVPAETTGRFVDTSAVEAYKLDLTGIAMPTTADWQALADRSTDSDTRQVPAMLPPAPIDGRTGIDGLISSYGLPPISIPMAVVAHGDIDTFSTHAHTGTVVVASAASPVAYGDHLTVEAGDGLDVTPFQGEPVSAAGGQTATLNLSGDAEVEINGTPLTHPTWARWAHSFLGLWLGGAIAALWAGIPLIRKLLAVR